MHFDNSTSVHVNEVKNFMGHSMKTRSWLNIVVIVVRDENARGVHGKSPESIEVDLLTQLQGSCHQHQAAAQSLRTDPLHCPETLHVQEILWVEEEHASLGVKIVQHVLDSERNISVAGVVEGGQHHGGVLVILKDFVKWSAPFLQLLKPAQVRRNKTMIKQHKKETDVISPSGPYKTHLSVIILGFIVTRSVLVPTSAEYFSLMGGTLHLQKDRKVHS